MRHAVRWAWRAALLLLLSTGSQPVCAGQGARVAALRRVDPDDLRPGLVATYRSLADRSAALTRLERKPAFYLGHSSPDPRLPPGPFEVTWTGMLFVKDAGPIVFDGFVGGEVVVAVDGVTVLRGQGLTDTARLRGKTPLDRKTGHYRITIRFRSLPKVPARVQLWWQGPGFAHEPLPPWHFHHGQADWPPAAAEEEQLEAGRAAVGRLGCARCHSDAFPGVAEPAPGPSLADVRGRVGRAWLLPWLENPAKVRADARMPALFAADRSGFVERWLIADYLLGPKQPARPVAVGPVGDHRAGRLAFLSLGCAACHFVPDVPRAQQSHLERWPLRGLADRLGGDALAAFLADPHGRYPDGRMPRLPLAPKAARDIAAYLLLWSPRTKDRPAARPPTAAEIEAIVNRLGAREPAAAAAILVQTKGCVACHPGLSPAASPAVPLKHLDPAAGCLGGKTLPRFALSPQTRQVVAGYLRVAKHERYPAPYATRQRLLARAGCRRCHQRDTDQAPPIEAVGSTLGGAFLQELPYQRTPRLTWAHQKHLRSYLAKAIREGISGLRTAQYSYCMPAYGAEADVLVQALAEADGDLPQAADPAQPAAADPTLGTLSGRALAGFQGYACVSCHVWNGKLLSQPDPGAIGPDLL
jgi:cytochrome c551/c552